METRLSVCHRVAQKSGCLLVLCWLLGHMETRLFAGCMELWAQTGSGVGSGVSQITQENEPGYEGKVLNPKEGT